MVCAAVRTFNSICCGVFLCGLLVGLARAERFDTTTGQAYSGEAVSFNEKGLVIRLDDGSYAERLDWGKFTQGSLKALAKNPKAAAFVEPFLEPAEENTAAVTREAIVIKTDYPKLERPPAQSVLKAVFSSSVGLVACLLFYAANLYAGYEISIFRARPAALVCGVAAVLPVIGPIIFLCLPTRIESKEGIVQEPAVDKEFYHVGDQPPPGPEAAELVDSAPGLPATETFARGEFTFNRRFFETKFPGFFGVIRREADKEMVLVFKAARGHYTVERITRLGVNELHVQVVRGTASEEVMIPFQEIQQVTLKHRDA
jgi:hypothetical protein